MSVVAMIEGSAIAAVVTNPRLPDNPIIACNDAFERLTGYDRREIVGRNCRFLAGASPDRSLSEELRAAVTERRPLFAEVLNFRKDGTPFRNALLIVPIFDVHGELDYFLGSQAEVAARMPAAGSEAAASRLASLTRRQQEVLGLMLAGMRNKQIARELGITERTVKMHRAATLRTLRVQTTTEAIRVAVEAGWSPSVVGGPRKPVGE